jgi:hypothetical protein
LRQPAGSLAYDNHGYQHYERQDDQAYDHREADPKSLKTPGQSM